jgi:VWFA-related protein
MIGRAHVVGGLVVLSLASSVPAAQTPTFSSRVDTVRVDVSVRQDGQAVRGLAAGDFEVLDNGVPQKVDLVGFEETPVNVVLALDMSGSVQGMRLTQLRTAGTRLVTALQPGDAGAMVAFTDLVTIRSGFTADRLRLLTTLTQPAAGTETALIDAAHAAMVLGDSATSGRPVVIIFSDGTDTSSFLSSELVLDTARRTGPVVYAVTSAQADSEFLDDLVRLTGGRRLDVTSLDRLSDAFAEILREARERYLLHYSPSGVSAGGWHEVTVRVRGRRADVRARPGYLGTR